MCVSRKEGRRGRGDGRGMVVCVSFTSVLCGLLSVPLFKTTGAQVFVKKTAESGHKIMIVCTCVHMHAMQSHWSDRCTKRRCFQGVSTDLE